MGAQIEGEGTSRIEIQGVDRLHGATHAVVADRIELGTYMLAPAIAGGEVECLGGRLDLVGAFVEKLDAAGNAVEETARGLRVSRKNGRIRAVDVTTEPFPGFPTDLQAQMMAMLCTAEGTSELNETIFENRFMHAPELTRMGARIEVHGGKARVTGVNKLRGPDRAMVLITHYQRLLDHIVPDVVHVLSKGRIVKTGDKDLALDLEKNGYADYIDTAA